MPKVVIVMGYNASGKSTLVQEFVSAGYYRINRDLTGGTLEGQADLARSALDDGKDVVLDNTYPTIESRKSIIAATKSAKGTITCVWLATEFEDAQLNACLRMVAKYGRIIQPEEFKKLKDPNCFPPAALFNYRKIFEKPTVTEGFDSVDKREFVRKWSSEYKNKAILLDYDGTLRVSTGKEEWPEDPADVKVLDGRKEVLQKYVDQGYRLLGVSNQSAIAKGLSTQKVIDCFKKTNDDLGFDIEYQFCPHRIPPVSCYCRKPHPAMGAFFIDKYKLNPAECIMVGDQTTDETFAERCGFQYQDASEFFK
jgi:HAD superfamily hydrolase (TIGR01662 family)